jgi:hypothetical protein
VFRCHLLWRQGVDCFSSGVGGVVAELVPVVTIVADEVGDLAEGLVRDGVF